MIIPFDEVEGFTPPKFDEVENHPPQNLVPASIAPMKMRENLTLGQEAGKVFKEFVSGGVDQKSSYSTSSVSVPHTSLNREKTLALNRYELLVTTREI